MTLTQAEIEAQARADYQRIHGREPDIAAENDHGSPTMRETLERQIAERMERLRTNVVARHEHRRREWERVERAADAAAQGMRAILRQHF